MYLVTEIDFAIKNISTKNANHIPLNKSYKKRPALGQFAVFKITTLKLS